MITFANELLAGDAKLAHFFFLVEQLKANFLNFFVLLHDFTHIVRRLKLVFLFFDVLAFAKALDLLLQNLSFKLSLTELLCDRLQVIFKFFFLIVESGNSDLLVFTLFLLFGKTNLNIAKRFFELLNFV